MKKSSVVFLSLALMLLLSACGTNSFRPAKGKYGIFQLEDSGTSARIENGVIGSKSLEHFEALMQDHPEVTRINIRQLPGSEDDATNVQLGRAIYAQGLHLHIEDNGMVASGGTDFFLAGQKRTIGSNVEIGVHSWSDGSQEATDFPEDSPEHQMFLDYYEAIGFSADWSREFYFFTINAAPASGIHNMSAAEIEYYGMLTD